MDVKRYDQIRSAIKLIEQDIMDLEKLKLDLVKKLEEVERTKQLLS